MIRRLTIIIVFAKCISIDIVVARYYAIRYHIIPDNIQAYQ